MADPVTDLVQDLAHARIQKEMVEDGKPAR